MAKRASVIVTTYDQPRHLERALCGFARQSSFDFELILADDGSGPETRACIERFAPDFPVPIHHVWQPDEGFRKALVCNRAVLHSRGSHLVFSDGDCVPSRTFVEEHLAAARPNAFVVGGHVRLSRERTASISPEDVRRGRLDAMRFPREEIGLHWEQAKNLLYVALDKPRKPKLYGLNFSVDRASFERVNGFDATFAGSGKDDSDLRNRMRLAGVRGVSLWHRARVFHLWHPPVPSRTVWAEAKAYYDRPDLVAEAPNGLRELAREIGRERESASGDLGRLAG